MTINAGPGNDRVTIEDVNGASGILLVVNGENGGDTINAGGADLGDVRLLVQGGDGNDVITGSDGDDVLRGDDGNDTVDGGAGDDTINGGANHDSLSGGDDDDRIDGGADNDTIAGGAGDVSDGVLLTTRAGSTRYDFTFKESFVRPGLGSENWTSRSNYPALGVVQTGPAEMSFYVQRHYGHEMAHLQRMTLRLDGFASLHAPYAGGQMVTTPLTFAGRYLELNYATSARKMARQATERLERVVHEAPGTCWGHLGFAVGESRH